MHHIVFVQYESICIPIETQSNYLPIYQIISVSDPLVSGDKFFHNTSEN